MKKKALLVLSFLFLSGCEPPAAGGPGTGLTSYRCADTVEFFREPKSGLCFATCWGGTYHGGTGLALVPDSVCGGRGANKRSQPGGEK